MVGISNDFLPHGTGSQDLALCTAPLRKQSASLPATRNVPMELPLALGNREMATAAQKNSELEPRDKRKTELEPDSHQGWRIDLPY